MLVRRASVALSFLAVSGLFAGAPEAIAQEAPPRDPPRALRIHPVGDGMASAALGAVWIGSELDKDRLAGEHCRWCEPTAVDVWARRAFRWDDPKKAGTLSDVLDFAVLPVAMLGMDALLASRHGVAGEAWPEDALIVVEAALAASLLNQVIKLGVLRERPLAYGLSPEEKRRTAHPSDNNLSFYSGHASLAFALVGATGAVATMRGYDDAWVIWPVGITAAVAVSWLRMAADKHWLTDVAAGAAIGGAVGVLMPALLHPPRTGGRTGTVTIATEAARGRRPPVFSVVIAF